MCEGSNSPHFHQHWLPIFALQPSQQARSDSSLWLWYAFPRWPTNEHLFECLSGTCLSSLEKCVFGVLVYVHLDCILIAEWCFKTYLRLVPDQLYKKKKKIPLLWMVFSLSWWYPLKHKTFWFWWSINSPIFVVVASAFGVLSRKHFSLQIMKIYTYLLSVL